MAKEGAKDSVQRLDLRNISIGGAIRGEILRGNGSKANITGRCPFGSPNKGFLKGNATHGSVAVSHHRVKDPTLTVLNRQ